MEALPQGNDMTDIRDHFLNEGEEITDDTRIYRVFSSERLSEMFHGKTLSLVVPAKWDDPFENFLAKCRAEYDTYRNVDISRSRHRRCARRATPLLNDLGVHTRNLACVLKAECTLMKREICRYEPKTHDEGEPHVRFREGAGGEIPPRYSTRDFHQDAGGAAAGCQRPAGPGSERRARRTRSRARGLPSSMELTIRECGAS
jgi:hypothetical protein